jgi:hypothetical protein
VSRSARPCAVLAALAVCCYVPTPAHAQARTSATIRPSFLPDQLAASTALTLAFRFSGGEEGVPAPLSEIVVRLPAGLGISVHGIATCAKARLLSKGPSGCPSGSLLGRGHATLEVHAGSQTIAEQATIWAFRGPNRGSNATLEIFGQGDTPLDESTISTAVLEPGIAPYGWRLTVSIPPIPSLVYEPDASFASLSLTVGASGSGRGGHTAVGAVIVPRRCPPGGFPFSAGFTFADHSTASATATVACP